MASRTRPRRAIVNFHGIDHEMNMPALRLALVRRQVASEFHSMEQLADAIGIRGGAPTELGSERWWTEADSNR